MNYKEIYNDIKEKTNNFKDLEGAYIVSSRIDLKSALDILGKLYKNVKKLGLNYNDDNTNGLNYEIVFSEPIQQILGEEHKMSNGFTSFDPLSVKYNGNEEVVIQSLKREILILSILLYTFSSRMFDLSYFL